VNDRMPVTVLGFYWEQEDFFSFFFAAFLLFSHMSVHQ